MKNERYFVDKNERPATEDFKAKVSVFRETEGGGSIVSAVAQGETEIEARETAGDVAAGLNLLDLVRKRIAELDGRILDITKSMSESFSRTAAKVAAMMGEECPPGGEDMIAVRTYAMLDIIRNEKTKMNNTERMLMQYQEERWTLLNLILKAKAMEGGESDDEGEEENE